MSEKSTTCQLRDVHDQAGLSRSLSLLRGRSVWLGVGFPWIVRFGILVGWPSGLTYHRNTTLAQLTGVATGPGSHLLSESLLIQTQPPTSSTRPPAATRIVIPAPTPSLVKGRLLRLAVNWLCEIPGEHTRDVGLRLGEDVGCTFKLWRWWQWTDQNVTARLSIPVAMAAIDLKESGRGSARRDFHRWVPPIPATYMITSAIHSGPVLVHSVNVKGHGAHQVIEHRSLCLLDSNRVSWNCVREVTSVNANVRISNCYHVFLPPFSRDSKSGFSFTSVPRKLQHRTCPRIVEVSNSEF